VIAFRGDGGWSYRHQPDPVALWLANTQVFWIEPGFSSGRWAVEWAVLHTLSGNLLLVAGAVAGAGLMLRDGAAAGFGRGQRDAPAGLRAGDGGGGVDRRAYDAPDADREISDRAGGGAVCAAGNGICAVVARGGPALGRGVGIGLALGVLSLWRNTHQAIAKPGWMGTGRAIAAIAARCPGAVMHTDPRWNANVLTALPRDNALVAPFAYRSIAGDLGFALAPAGSKEHGPIMSDHFLGRA
jgi:hypothetical protein